MGKRQLGELQPSELVITILISNIASLPIEDPDIPLIIGIIPVFVLVGCELLISNISLKSRKFRGLISGAPIVIIKDGELLQPQLRRLRFSIDDLTEALRQSGIFDIREVDYAVVETTGKVSVLQKCAERPLSQGFLCVKQTDVTPPSVIISDGEFLTSAAEECGMTHSQAERLLRGKGYEIKDVFLMTCDKTGDYYIIPKV